MCAIIIINLCFIIIIWYLILGFMYTRNINEFILDKSILTTRLRNNQTYNSVINSTPYEANIDENVVHLMK